jgi:hypothetical protein
MNDHPDSNANEETWCDICGRERPCSIVASGCAPVTYCACDECCSHGAENLNVIMTKLVFAGGNSDEMEYCGPLRSFHEGIYIEWPEVLAYFDANKETVTATVRENFASVG